MFSTLLYNASLMLSHICDRFILVQTTSNSLDSQLSYKLHQVPFLFENLSKTRSRSVGTLFRWDLAFLCYRELFSPYLTLIIP